MGKRGVGSASKGKLSAVRKAVHAVSDMLALIGAVIVAILESSFRAVFIRHHEMKEKGFTISYDQNWLTGEVVEVSFRFKRARPERTLASFLQGVVSRACSTMPVEIFFFHKNGKPFTFRFPKAKAFFSSLRKSSCPDPGCPDRSFEVVENKDPASFLRFHVPHSPVKEVCVSGNRPMLRRVFHFA